MSLASGSKDRSIRTEANLFLTPDSKRPRTDWNIDGDMNVKVCASPGPRPDSLVTMEPLSTSVALALAQSIRRTPTQPYAAYEDDNDDGTTERSKGLTCGESDKAVESRLLSTLPERDAVRKFYIELRDLKKKLGSDWLPKPRKEHRALYKKMGAFRSLYLRKACSQKITRKPLSLEQSWLLSLLPGVLGDDVLASILHLFGTCLRPPPVPTFT